MRFHSWTIATVRVDGFPEATTVSFMNDGLRIYFGTATNSQKARNIAQNDKVSLTMGSLKVKQVISRVARGCGPSCPNRANPSRWEPMVGISGNGTTGQRTFTMRLTVLKQFSKGMIHADAKIGQLF